MSNDNTCPALVALKLAGMKKAFQSFKDLSHGEYIVDKFTTVQTAHGIRVRIDMGDTYMFLPERYANLTEEDIKTLNQTPKIMVYSGKDSSDRDRLILDFRDTNTYFAEVMQVTPELFEEDK